MSLNGISLELRNMPDEAAIAIQLEEYERDVRTFRITMGINGIFALITNIVAVYMIIYKTPKQMGAYKWYLLNIAIWSCLLDIHLGIFYAPHLMFPALGVCTDGVILGGISHQAMLIIFFITFTTLLGCAGCAVVTAFIYRLASIAQISHILHRPVVLFCIGLVHITYTFPAVFFILYACVADMHAVEEEVARKHPAAYRYSLTHPCLYISMTITPIATKMFLIMALFLLANCVVIILCLMYYVLSMVQKNKSRMSMRTYSMHRQLAFSLFAQFIIPVTFLAIPFAVLVTLVLMDLIDSPLARSAGLMFFEMGSLHSTLNSLSMILLTSPYRRALLRPLAQLFNCDCIQITGLSTHSSSLNMTQYRRDTIYRPRTLRVGFARVFMVSNSLSK